MSDSNQAFYATVPQAVPKTRSPRLMRFCRWLIKVLGWRFVGEIPAESKAVVIVAPHTSNMDFILLVFVKYALGIGASYVMKKEAFFWPFKNLFIDIGGIPIDRSKPLRIVSQVTKEFRRKDSMWLAITPEGTRKKVHKYKTGFARIAFAANVPVLLIGFNYKEKTLTFDKCWRVSDNYDREADNLRDYVREHFVGRHPEQQ